MRAVLILLLAAGSISACSAGRAAGPWPIPEAPPAAVLPPAPPLPAVAGCLAGALVDVSPREACPAGSSLVLVLEADVARKEATWRRDVADAWARTVAAWDDYRRRVEVQLKAINRAGRR